MIQVYSQVLLQFLLIVVDLLFVAFAHVLCNLLSVFDNPATQIASILSSVTSFVLMWIMEFSRARARKKNTDCLLNEYPGSTGGGAGPSASLAPSKSPTEVHDTEYRGRGSVRAARNRLNVSVTLLFVLILGLARYGPKALQLALSDLASPKPEVLISNIGEASRNNTAYTVFQSDSKMSSKANYYDLNVNYNMTDNYENTVQTRLPQYHEKFYNPWFLRGAEVHNFTFENGTTTLCGISDQWIDMVLQTGPLTHQIMSPIVPFIPRLTCQVLAKDIYTDSSKVYFVLEQNFSSPFVFESTYLYSDYVGYPQDNYTLFMVDTTNSSVFATTLSYDNSSYSLYSMKPMNDSSPGGIRASNLTKDIEMYNTSISDPGIWTMVNNDTSGYVYTPVRTIQAGINELISVFQKQLTDSCASFTLMHNDSATSTWFYYNRVIMCYREPTDQLTISQVRYSTRTLIYDISKEPTIEPQPLVRIIRYTNHSMMYFLPARVFPIISNIKISPFLYGAFQRATGYTVQNNATTLYIHNGRLKYNITPIIYTICIVAGVSVLVHFICKVLLRKTPQGIPSYYALLHEYHQYQDSCTLPLSFIVSPAYEGAGYDEANNRNHIGVLDTQAYLRGPMPNVRFGATSAKQPV